MAVEMKENGEIRHKTKKTCLVFKTVLSPILGLKTYK